PVPTSADFSARDVGNGEWSGKVNCTLYTGPADQVSSAPPGVSSDFKLSRGRLAQARMKPPDITHLLDEQAGVGLGISQHLIPAPDHECFCCLRSSATRSCPRDAQRD